MNKTLLTAALACVLAIGGITASAKTYTPDENGSFGGANAFPSKGSESLKVLVVNPNSIDSEKKPASINLSEFLTTVDKNEVKYEFGYLKTGADNKTEFVSLSSLLNKNGNTVADDAKVATISLGSFKRGDSFQFVYAGSNGSYVPANKISAGGQGDALYYAGFDQDSFFKLDFSEDPFSGNIEILVMGEPLPPATVTLLVALAAGSAFLLYSKRRRVRCAEQA